VCSQNFTPLNKCIACGSDKLKLVLDLGKQPPANSYKDKADDVQESFPLAINRCDACFHVQLTGIVDPDLLYKNYLYVSGTSETMKRHFEWFAKWADEYQTPFRDFATSREVLDIGCNDGSQLDAFKALRYKTYGVDPAENLHATSTAKGHDVSCCYFDLDFVDATMHKVTSINLDHRYDIITAQNVFAHNPDPVSFLKTARRVMWDESLLFVQTSQADMILNNEFDTIYHEHISFYNIKSMNELCKRSDMELIDVIKCPLHGNSYIFVISRNSDRARPVHIQNLIDMEAKTGLYTKETYKKFAENAKHIAAELKHTVESYTRHEVGWFAVGYGAAAKGMTLLNFSGAKLDFIVDDNPLKQGKFTPGQGIPIVSSDELKKHKNELLLVPLAWNFYDEIKAKIKKLHNNEYDVYVKYFPNVEPEFNR
jgi:2-polyprenyl-3-methyl-5-hydroxy-6-metoxy-1,4-benzoquinol methylase